VLLFEHFESYLLSSSPLSTDKNAQLTEQRVEVLPNIGGLDGAGSIRTSTASTESPTIAVRLVPPFSDFKPATVTEIVSLLKKAPAKSCELDPIPTWLLN